MSTECLTRVFNLAYECLRRKVNGGGIHVDNEASLQLQFASILKSVGTGGIVTQLCGAAGKSEAGGFIE